VCVSVCLVTLVYCGQTVGWIKMPLGMEVGLDPGHIVLDGDPAVPTQRGTAPTHFLTHVYCGQTAGWMNTLLRMEVGLGPGDSVLDEDPALIPYYHYGGDLPSPPCSSFFSLYLILLSGRA